MKQRTNHAQEADVTEETATGTGWLLPLPENRWGAVGEMEMIYVFPFEPDMFRVPISPKYSRGVLVWQKLVVPIIDLAAYLAVILDDGSPTEIQISRTNPGDDGKIPEPESQSNEIVALFAYRERLGNMQDLALGALVLNGVPERLVVSDDHACDLPEPANSWSEIARSSFLHDQFGAIPILDLAAVFSSAEGIPTNQPHASNTVLEQN